MMTYKIILSGQEKVGVVFDAEDIEKVTSSTAEWVVLKAGVFQRSHIDGFIPYGRVNGALIDCTTEIKPPLEPYKGSPAQLPAFTRRLPGQPPARLRAK